MRRWWQIIKEFSNKHISCLSIALGTQHIFTSLYMGHINILCCQSRGIDISSMYIAKHIYTACCMVLTEPLSSPCIIASDTTGDDIDVSVAACYEPGENVSNFSDTLSKEGTYKSIKHKILRIFLHYTPYITILVLSNHNQHHFWLNHVPTL